MPEIKATRYPITILKGKKMDTISLLIQHLEVGRIKANIKRRTHIEMFYKISKHTNYISYQI